MTPNRLSGPHDISARFDDVPRGFHLREYTTGELRSLFREAGFSRVAAFARLKRFGRAIPAPPVVALEVLLDRLPPSRRRRAVLLPFIRNVLSGVIGYR
jgi:hypothetical protein